MNVPSKIIIGVIIGIVVIAVGYLIIMQAVPSLFAPTPQTTIPAPIINPSPTVEILPTPTSQPVNQLAPISSPTIESTPVAQPASPALSSATVMISGFSFGQAVTIKKGATINWLNNDFAPHTVTGDGVGPNSPTLSQNAGYQFTFNNIGVFNYHCAFHPSMHGVVRVVE